MPEAQAQSVSTKTDGAELGQPRHQKRALIRALRLFLITAERVSDLVPRETLEYVHAHLGRTSRGHLYLPWIRSNDHEKTGDTLTRRARVTKKVEKPAARFKFGATIVRAALSLVECPNCFTQRSVVEPMWCACRGHK